jgi:D-alanine-D-alanine ligase
MTAGRGRAGDLHARRKRRRRLRVAVIFGGRSVEHDVSLVSARAIMSALDPARYEVVPIAVSRRGTFDGSGSGALLRENPAIAELFRLTRGGPGRSGRHGGSGPIDVVFPIVHGTGGEDGVLQGLLTLADMPFVGAGVLGSALGMDKAAMKVMFQQAGLPIVRYHALARHEFDADRAGAATRMGNHCGFPCFVKPANGGSSVGVSKVRDRESLAAAMRLAFRYDRRLVVETAIDAREVECSVLGNERPEVSIAGEIVPAGEFYDYAAKYLDTGSRLIIPAPLTAIQQSLVRDIAARAFQVLDLSGMARVDFFVERSSGAVYLNEVNTLPGFTSISMYPKLWEATGVSFADLVDRLIALALERHARGADLVTTYTPSPAPRRRRHG